MTPKSSSCACLTAVALIAASMAPAAAEPTSRMPEIEVRLLDGGTQDAATGARLAGVRIDLEEGWKTYWRHPGDSGIPPSFDFSRSVNVAEAEVQWPSPSLTHDGFGWVIGYEKEVVFPVVVTPEDPGKPVVLALDLGFAVCADICIPLDDTDRIRLDGPGADRLTIELHMATVPVTVENGDPRGGVQTVTRATTADGMALDMTIRFPDAPTDPVVLVEGPPGWHPPIPELVADDGNGSLTYRLPAKALPAPGEAGTPLRVTGVSRGFSFEQRVTLP